MRRFLSFLFLLTLVAAPVFAQSMTDEQVVEYLRQAQAMGKPQSQMATELMRRGVTQPQLERIKKMYQGAESGGITPQSATSADSRLRVRDMEADVLLAAPRTIRAVETPDMTGDEQAVLYDEEGNPVKVRVLYDAMGNPITAVMGGEDTTKQVFGHNFFSNKNLTFEPNVNVATPDNYKLGAGDEVIIDIWGASETTARKEISPDGNIQISGLGPVHLAGMTVRAAKDYLQRELSKIYAGIDGQTPDTQVQVTLGNSRSILISVMGEVVAPGTYTLSAFSSVFHALYSAGGVNDIGSLRSVKVHRAGKTVADVDVYSYIMSGRMTDDVRLQEGDVVYVEPYHELVQITGKVKRPMFYEMKRSETVATLLQYAGGFTGDAYKKAVRLIRKTGREHQVYNVDEMDYSVFALEDGDELSVDSVLTRFENRVEVRGAVYREGIYQLDKQVKTVRELISKAEGLRGDAFMERAVLDREKDNYDHEIVAVNIKGVLEGVVPDIPLKKNDVLYIPSIHDLKERETVSIHGQVGQPGVYLFSQNLAVEDLIVMAGGLLEDASVIRVEVTRRLKDSDGDTYSDEIGETFSIDLSEGLSISGEPFFLQPFDEVYVRKSPSYRKQQNVTISGEVLFGGRYALTNKNERISTLVARAGGVTPSAYIRGARLLRQRTEDERRRQEDLLKMAKNTDGNDSIKVESLDISSVYTVGIDLENALKYPNSDYDVVLRDSDVLFVPEYVSTVKISGEVMYPNTVLYKQGAGVSYYINQAGGFGDLARKRRVYVVYMNGMVARLNSRNAKHIEPGCEIVVPSRDKSRRMSLQEISSIGTTTASLAAVIASVVNLIKR